MCVNAREVKNLLMFHKDADIYPPYVLNVKEVELWTLDDNNPISVIALWG